MAKNSYYVVWRGLNPGIYTSWDECREQINGFQSAQYKGFKTRQEAEEALANGYEPKTVTKQKGGADPSSRPDELCICVDAACSGNPGIMEYQGVWGGNGDVIFREGPFREATNNIGEFIAIVHGLSWLKKNNLPIPLYSDSKTAMAWVRKGKANTKVVCTGANEKVFRLLRRAEEWLKQNAVHNEVRKWNTEMWGEIPADFGRK